MDRHISKIIVHCSASTWADAEVIREWHTEPPRSWRDIGYHYIILNGYRTYNSFRDKKRLLSEVGIVEKGREDKIAGAHVRGMNLNSLGICLIGDRKFPRKQIKSLIYLLSRLVLQYKLEFRDVLGHCETPTGKEQGKTCPNLDMTVIRRKLKRKLFWKRFMNIFC